jgi:hypothetical protein
MPARGERIIAAEIPDVPFSVVRIENYFGSVKK